MVVTERRPARLQAGIPITRPKPALESLGLAGNSQIVNDGSIRDIAKLFHTLNQEALERGGYNLGTYEMFRLIAEKLPDMVSEDQQKSALIAAKDNDPNISREGRDAFFLLKARTLLS